MPDNQTAIQTEATSTARVTSKLPSLREIIHYLSFGIVMFAIAMKIMNFVFPFTLGVYFPDFVRAFCAGWRPAYLSIIALWIWGFTRS